MGSITPSEVALRQYQATENRVVRITPNFADEDDLKLVVVDDLVEPLADLFATRNMVRMLQRSDAFKEAINERKALEWLLRDLADLERALVRRWEST